jgi:hypothetical protein
MIEVYGNLWTYQPADAICITTNGYVTKEGHATMGAGCALEAKARYPGISKVLGDLIFHWGNHVFWLGKKDPFLFSFPVKVHWGQPANLGLIAQSANELVERVNEEPWDQWTDILIPRPGCGNGRLSWEQVKPVINPILDDRFKIITFA